MRFLAKVASLAIILLLIGFNYAHACMVSGTSDEKQKDIVNSAVFIGIVVIDDVEFLKSKPVSIEQMMQHPLAQKRYRLKVSELSTFKGSLPKNRDIFIINAGSDCEVFAYKKGQIYRVIVAGSDHDELQFLGGQHIELSQDLWAQLESKSSKSAALVDIEKKCAISGGALVFKSSQATCIHKTKDFNHACLSSLECEGFCIGNPTPDQEKELNRERLDKKTPKIEAIGKCSETKEQQNYCAYGVQNGYYRNECRAEY